MKTVLLFPGQGSQSAGMLHNLPVEDAAITEIFEQAHEVLHTPVYTLDLPGKMTSTVYVQVCLLIEEVASAKYAIHRGIQPDFVAGHSVGAFAAAVISGVLSFEQALTVVYTRGMLMAQAYPVGYGMAAVTGLREPAIVDLIGVHNQSHAPVYLANVNAANQQVIAGELDSVHQFVEVVKGRAGVKTKVLDVAVPSHCALLNDVADKLREKLLRYELKEPTIPYASNHTGRLLKTAADIREDLWISVSKTVRWYDATSLIYELGARIFVEVQPSGVLAKLAKESFPAATVLAMNSRNIDDISWLWTQMQEEVV